MRCHELVKKLKCITTIRFTSVWTSAPYEFLLRPSQVNLKVNLTMKIIVKCSIHVHYPVGLTQLYFECVGITSLSIYNVYTVYLYTILLIYNTCLLCVCGVVGSVNRYLGLFPRSGVCSASFRWDFTSYYLLSGPIIAFHSSRSSWYFEYVHVTIFIFVHSCILRRQTICISYSYILRVILYTFY